MPHVGSHVGAYAQPDAHSDDGCALRDANVGADAWSVVRRRVLGARGERVRRNAWRVLLRRRRLRHKVMPLQSGLRVQRHELLDVHDKPNRGADERAI